VRLVHLPTVLRVVAAEHRIQQRNRDLAFERLQRKIEALNRPVPARHRTRKSTASVVRRLEEKRRRRAQEDAQAARRVEE